MGLFQRLKVLWWLSEQDWTTYTMNGQKVSKNEFESVFGDNSTYTITQNPEYAVFITPNKVEEVFNQGGDIDQALN